MNHSLLLASGLAALAALWSLPPIRDCAVEWLPDSLDEFADKWVGSVLCIVVVVLCFVGSKNVPVATPSPSRSNGAVATLTQVDGRPGRHPQSFRSGPNLAGRVVARDPSGQLTPVTVGKAHLGQSSSDLAPDGSFQLSVPDSPQLDTLLGIESPPYLKRFLRMDDESLAQQKPVELEPKRRIMVIPARAADRNSGDEIRRGMENQFSQVDIELVSDDKQRDEVLDVLYTYQQNGALYDPKTIARVGNFYGATDGVFWSLIRDTDSFSIEARLVNLTTAKVEPTVTVRFRKGASTAAAAAVTADLLLSKIARAVILEPKHEANVRRNISVSGYSAYIPKSWTLWIAVLPKGNSRYFPQARLSAHGDESFYASDVYVGPEGALGQKLRVSIYAVLTDPEHSQLIQSYLGSQSQGGLDMNSWETASCRLLHQITVVRTQ